MRSVKTSFYILLVLANCQAGFSQSDTSYLKSLYDRVLDFNETNADSVLYYAEYITEQSKKLNFNKGDVLSLRLKGIYKELKNDYDSAIYYYYQTLEEARKLNSYDYEAAALGDLAIAYNNINQPEKTKELYKEALEVSLKRKEISSIFTNSSNLGSVYTRLGQPDSALIFLGRAEELVKKYKIHFDLGSFYNNIGNAWFYKKEWDKALGFFRLNYDADVAEGNKEMLWYDCLNMGDVYTEKRNFDSAGKYINKSFELARALGSRKKESDVYFLYAKYYSRKGDYKSAFNHFEAWHNLDTSLIKQQMLHTVAELQERFNIKRKEHENKLLASEIERQKLQKRNISILAFGIASLAISALIILLLIRRKNGQLQKQNKLIHKQNHKLAQFNDEKNSLISVVSHDLSGPFTSIKMWTQILQSDISNFTPDQKKALYRIQSSADNGELLIRNILFIEKEEINKHALNLEHLDLNAFLEDMVSLYYPQAQQKEINLIFKPAEKPVYIISDRYFVSRICENLFSNAVKFTPRGKSIRVILQEEANVIHIKIEDEGMGITPEDIPYLFSRYRKISSMPTEGEYSTGLGLSIVKRLVEELNGKITCESELGKGSVFTVTLQK